jgi:hypothetical protein
MFIFVDFNLFLFSRLTNVTKVLVFMQKMAIFCSVKKGLEVGRQRKKKNGKRWREFKGSGGGVKGIF